MFAFFHPCAFSLPLRYVRSCFAFRSLEKGRLLCWSILLAWLWDSCPPASPFLPSRLYFEAPSRRSALAEALVREARLAHSFLKQKKEKRKIWRSVPAFGVVMAISIATFPVAPPPFFLAVRGPCTAASSSARPATCVNGRVPASCCQPVGVSFLFTRRYGGLLTNGGLWQLVPGSLLRSGRFRPRTVWVSIRVVPQVHGAVL